MRVLHCHSCLELQRHSHAGRVAEILVRWRAHCHWCGLLHCYYPLDAGRAHLQPTEHSTLSNRTVSMKTIIWDAHMLHISTKPTPLSSPSYLLSDINCISLSSTEIAYFSISFILQLTHTASRVGQVENKHGTATLPWAKSVTRSWFSGTRVLLTWTFYVRHTQHEFMCL